MLYAKFMYSDSGYASDIEIAKNAGLKIGQRYEVEDLSMGQSYTSIYLKRIGGPFNSVQFDYEEEDGMPVNIYEDKRYNPYM